MSYSWGDDTGSSSSGKSRATSGGYDYRSARKAYETPREEPPRSRSSSDSRSTGSARSAFTSESRREHDFSSARDKTPWPIKRETLAVKTASTHPGVICADDTGSFITEIKVILEKLPLLGKEWKRYMPVYELCLALIGDTTSDSQPLQIQDFDKDEALDLKIAALYPEGGGGDAPESYDLAAYYFTHHCEMPNAVIKPIFIWILDSTTRNHLYARDVRKYIGDDVQSDLDSVKVLKKLDEKFSVWVILKNSSEKSFWSRIYGEQKIIPLDNPRDIIEMLIAIVASEAGRYEDFAERMSSRHSDKLDRISRVMRSTKSAREASAKASASAGDGVAAKTDGSSKKAEPSLRSKKLV